MVTNLGIFNKTWGRLQLYKKTIYFWWYFWLVATKETFPALLLARKNWRFSTRPGTFPVGFLVKKMGLLSQNVIFFKKCHNTNGTIRNVKLYYIHGIWLYTFPTLILAIGLPFFLHLISPRASETASWKDLKKKPHRHQCALTVFDDCLHLLPHVETQRTHVFGHIDETSGGRDRICDGVVRSAGSRIRQFRRVVTKTERKVQKRRKLFFTLPVSFCISGRKIENLY